jgi:hypothetical protein
VRPTKGFVVNPELPPVTIPKGGIVFTDAYSPFSEQTWFRGEVMPVDMWLSTDQFGNDFEEII